MKKTYIRSFQVFLVAGLLAATSCKKNIDLVPTDSITSVNAFATSSDIEAGLVGVYTELAVGTGAGNGGAGYDNEIYASAIMSDEVRNGLDNNSRNYGAEQRWQFDASNPGANDVVTVWIVYYNAIDRLNRVLDAMSSIPAPQATKDRQTGELLALRGFLHFELLRNYAQTYDAASAGVPIMLKSAVFGQPARNSFAEVIAQVKKDLTQAKTLIPTTNTDPTRFTRTAVSAVQARVALYEKNYADAITYSTEVINALPLATKAQFPGVWTDANTSEVAFEIKRSSTTLFTGLLFRDSNNDVFFSPSFKTIDLFDKTNDVRYNSFIKQDLTIAATKEQWLVVKYAGNGSVKTNNTKVFRTGEMYLIRAEAYEQNNDLVNGAADLNNLRAARITGYVPQVFATKADLDAAIMTERMKELFAEGHRFFDLRRKGAAVNRDARDIANNSTLPQNLNPTDRNYALPVPQAEVFANPNLVNNKGY